MEVGFLASSPETSADLSRQSAIRSIGVRQSLDRLLAEAEAIDQVQKDRRVSQQAASERVENVSIAAEQAFQAGQTDVVNPNPTLGSFLDVIV